MVISVYWLAHRRFMATILTVDAPITVITLVMLSLVALLPAATRRLAHAHSDQPQIMVAYGGLVIAIGVSIWRRCGPYAAPHRQGRAGRRFRGPSDGFLFFLMLFTPPLFLVLVTALPTHGPGVTPLGLIVLFLVGWRLRLWFQRRLAGARTGASEPVGGEAQPTEASSGVRGRPDL